MDIESKKSIDEILKNFELSNVDDETTDQCKPLTFWLPIEYKDQYDLIQARSKKKFGKILKEVLKRSIDQVKAG